jgi:hypothetical protein
MSPKSSKFLRNFMLQADFVCIRFEILTGPESLEGGVSRNGHRLHVAWPAVASCLDMAFLSTEAAVMGMKNLSVSFWSKPCCRVRLGTCFEATYIGAGNQRSMFS